MCVRDTFAATHLGGRGPPLSSQWDIYAQGGPVLPALPQWEDGHLISISQAAWVNMDLAV